MNREIITITRHGIPVMTLNPISTFPKTPLKDVIAAIKAFLKGNLIEERSIHELVEGGRMKMKPSSFVVDTLIALAWWDNTFYRIHLSITSDFYFGNDSLIRK